MIICITQELREIFYTFIIEGLWFLNIRVLRVIKYLDVAKRSSSVSVNSRRRIPWDFACLPKETRGKMSSLWSWDTVEPVIKERETKSLSSSMGWVVIHKAIAKMTCQSSRSIRRSFPRRDNCSERRLICDLRENWTFYCRWRFRVAFDMPHWSATGSFFRDGVGATHTRLYFMCW